MLASRVRFLSAKTQNKNSKTLELGLIAAIEKCSSRPSDRDRLKGSFDRGFGYHEVFVSFCRGAIFIAQSLRQNRAKKALAKFYVEFHTLYFLRRALDVGKKLANYMCTKSVHYVNIIDGEVYR